MLRLRSCALVAAVVLLGGCSSSDSEQSADGPEDTEQSAEGSDGPLTGVDVSDASAAQAEEISDREVTLDEYQAAFQRYRECLSAAGFELENVQLNSQVYEFGVPGEAVESGADAECYDAEYRYVDMIWQSRDEIRNNSDTAQFTRECLQDHGVEPADTLDEMNQQMREAGIDPPDCF